MINDASQGPIAGNLRILPLASRAQGYARAVNMFPCKKNNIGGAERTRRHGRSMVFRRMLRYYPFRVYRDDERERTASGIATHARTRARPRPAAQRNAQHRFNRNRSTISKRSFDPCGLSRARTRTRGNTRGKSKLKPGSRPSALMWPPLLPSSPSRIPLYAPLTLLFLPSLLSLCLPTPTCIVRSSSPCSHPFPPSYCLFRSPSHLYVRTELTLRLISLSSRGELSSRPLRRLNRVARR